MNTSDTDIRRSDLVLSLAQRLLLLLCFFLVCWLLTAGLSYILGKLLIGKAAAAVRIGSVVQDVVAFVIPSAATALLICRRPAWLLCLKTAPHPLMYVLVAVMLLVSIPAQEAVIWWNANIHLPQSMAAFEAAARQLEDMAASTMAMLMADTSIMALITNILIVGILAGFSEELLFRGCLQRLLTTAGVNHHLAIWLVAFSFSALHAQLFGFVPRMLLGAYFGYLLWWSRSLWVPVTAHVLNNTIYAISAWHTVRTGGTAALDATPSLWPAWLTALSVAAIIVLLMLMHRTSATYSKLSAK